MRTNNIKEVMSFEKLSTWRIFAGLYKRYATELWAFMSFSLLAYAIWSRLV